jgi:hypothetical protein
MNKHKLRMKFIISLFIEKIITPIILTIKIKSNRNFEISYKEEILFLMKKYINLKISIKISIKANEEYNISIIKFSLLL